MIKDLKSKIPVKDGNITSGIKAKNDKGKEYPKSIHIGTFFYYC